MAENNAPPVTYTMDDMNDMTDTQFLDMTLQKLDKVLVEHGLTPTEVQKLRPKCSVSVSRTARYRLLINSRMCYEDIGGDNRDVPNM